MIEDVGEHSLPRFSTSFVGRDKETRDLCRLVVDNRFVGLVGPGGVGKTRLAAVAASKLRDRFPEGVVAVDLEGTATPAELSARVAGAIGLRDSQSVSVDALVAVLRGRSTLLVLDGCELLDSDCLLVLQDLVDGSGSLSILATSRRALHVDGGVVQKLAPLSVPPPESDRQQTNSSAAELEPYEAVNLFVERARLVQPEFQVTTTNAPAVATLCRGLDGLPLAIELAASWVRALSVDQIVDRMKETLDFPRAGVGDVHQPRHRTLGSLVAGTYDLCLPEERLLWSRMTIFTGTFDLEAVEAICATPPLDKTDILDTIAALVDQSVLVVDDIAGNSRYRLLRITRDYAATRFAEKEVFAERHRAHFANVTEDVTRRLPGPSQVRLLSQLQLDYPNILAAIDHGLQAADTAPTSVRMAADLWVLWFVTGRLTEGRSVLRRAVASPLVDPHSTDRVRALYVNAFLCLFQGELRSARKSHEVAAASDGPRDDLLIRGMRLHVDAMIRMADSETESPAELLDQAIANYGELADARGRVMFLDATGVAVVLAALSGDSERANSLGERGLTACDEYGDVLWRGYIEYALGVDAWIRGDDAQARRAALATLRSSPDELLVTHCIELLAWCAARQQRFAVAARYFGAADRRWGYLGGNFSGFKGISTHRDRWIAETKTALAAAAFASAYVEGAGLSVVEILAEPEPPQTADEVEGREPLSARELEVAHLVAQGLTNREIAATLVISPRTAESHVDHILTKLNLPNRTQVAAWMLARTSARRA